MTLHLLLPIDLPTPICPWRPPSHPLSSENTCQLLAGLISLSLGLRQGKVHPDAENVSAFWLYLQRVGINTCDTDYSGYRNSVVVLVLGGSTEVSWAERGWSWLGASHSPDHASVSFWFYFVVC